jgi:hypothetical protein
VDVPLRNWTVPAFTQSSAGGIHTMTDVSGPRAFVPLQPCRVADTRGNGAPITGGILANSDSRTWSVGGICGIPNGLDPAAISVNFTVVSAPATPQGAFLLAWPAGSPPANPVAVLTYGPGTTVLSNAAIVPMNSAEQLTINVSHSTHVIMDVNGYFSDTIVGSSGFYLETSATYAAFFKNKSTSCTGNCGVFGVIQSTGAAAGVSGLASSGGGNSAGVLGRQSFVNSVPGYPGAGVRGESPTLGVLGITNSTVDGSVAVAGSLLNTNGAALAEGYVGYHTAAANYGLYTTANLGGAGSKFFVEPHPTDASKVIRYISLEGPEPGTYFRGRGRFQRGTARIAVPEDFRMVTDAEGLSVQVTPIGGMASVGVLKVNLNEIVVAGSRDLEFYYTVNGIRRTQKHLTSPIGEGSEFAPRSPEATMPLSFSEEQRRLLIQNGTYKADGTVNMETARRLGWDRTWEARSHPVPQPAEP